MDNVLSFKDKLFEFFTKLNWYRLGISAVAALLIIFNYTLYENRQVIFNLAKPLVTVSANTITADYRLEYPSVVGKNILNKLTLLHPEISMVSVIDADQISNSRTVVYRTFNDPVIEKIIKSTAEKIPDVGNGALFTSGDEASNIQVLAMLNGEFLCTPASGILVKAFPELGPHIEYQCMVPLPPAYNKATGWLTLHLKEWPVTDFNRLKNNSLIAALEYYNKEVLGLTD